MGCRAPAFGDVLCHRYLSAPPALASEEYGHVGFGPKCGVFSLPGLCAGVPPMSCHSLCLAAGCQTSAVLQDLGVSQVTLDLVFLIFSVQVLTLQFQEHSRFKAFLHNVYIVGFCVFGWGFLNVLSVLAALDSGDLLGGPRAHFCVTDQELSFLLLHTCRRCSQLERVLQKPVLKPVLLALWL